MSEAFEEAFNLLCGDKLGYGVSRNVFECTLVPDCVVKVETDPRRFQNVMEWEIWQRVRDTPASRWFAAARWISPNGKILIMERTRPPAATEYLEKVPAWFTDLKRQTHFQRLQDRAFQRVGESISVRRKPAHVRFHE